MDSRVTTAYDELIVVRDHPDGREINSSIIYTHWPFVKFDSLPLLYIKNKLQFSTATNHASRGLMQRRLMRKRV